MRLLSPCATSILCLPAVTVNISTGIFLIGRLTGTLIEVDSNLLLVDVGGVGYEVEVSAAVLQTLPATGEQLVLHAHFVVREDAQLLYGFNGKSERELFRSFIRISGVGPKLALSLISSLDRRALSTAVRNNDVSMLTKVPGVGKKTAERLMVELKSKVDELGEGEAVSLSVVGGVRNPGDMLAEAEDALVALGYKPVDASRAVAAVTADAESEDAELTAQQVVRLALRGFARSNS